MNNIFKGLGVALITPFCEDGSVDYAALKSLIDFQIEGGIDFLCVLGTTAETPCLTVEEKIALKNAAVEAVDGRVPILLGMGGNNTAMLVEEIKKFDFRGVDGILCVVPYYNKPSQEGLRLHFKHVAEAAGDIPVVLYNVPGRTGVNMQAATTLRLAREVDNIVAVKEASGCVEQIADIVQSAPEGFGVLSGDDGLTCELIERGACGVISVVGNALPKTLAEMVHCALNDDKPKAGEIDARLKKLYRLAFADGNPAGIKALLEAKGRCCNVLRLPLVKATAPVAEALRAFADLD